MGKLGNLLTSTSRSLSDVTKLLDELSPAERVAECRDLSPKQLARMWELANHAGGELSPEYFVPADAKALQPFPFEGKNSLPAFRDFRKTFYRCSDGTTIAGMNQQALGPITGPGYYILESFDNEPGSMGVNYFKVPTEKPADWPPIQPNDAGLNLSRFIYANMIDYLRWVSEDVVIGRAYKHGSVAMKAWFVLCRAAS